MDINEPEEGYYRRKLVRGGPWVPARIWWVRGEIDPVTGHQMSDDVLKCVVNGHDRDPYKEWMWLCDHQITEAEFRYMVDKADHARRLQPDEPEANAKQPINFNKMDPLF